MTRAEVRRLLGGHAPGTLTETERKALYAAALEDQALFDTLMDEEALRELLADPEAKARLLAALAEAPPKVVPFWRRPGILGAAAGLIAATTAGLAYLRSPQDLPRPVVTPKPAPTSPLPATPAAPMDQAKRPSKSELKQVRAEEAPQPSAAAAPSLPVDGTRLKAESQRQKALEEMVETAAGIRSSEMRSLSPAPVPARRVATEVGAALAQAPVWTLETLPDGATRVMVAAPREAHVVLLRRSSSRVEVLEHEPREASGPWLFRVRLAPGDALDLYLLDGAAVDPARLSETGPVDGFRARIHPAANR